MARGGKGLRRQTLVGLEKGIERRERAGGRGVRRIDLPREVVIHLAAARPGVGARCQVGPKAVVRIGAQAKPCCVKPPGSLGPFGVGRMKTSQFGEALSDQRVEALELG